MLVQSPWVTGQLRTCFLELEAEIITEPQVRNEKSERSHRKKRKRQLRELGIKLSTLRCCILNHVAL